MKQHSRGQLAILAVASFLLIVGVVIYYQFSSDQTHSQIKRDVDVAQKVTTSQKNLQIVLSSILREKLYLSVEEIALHGGYRRERLPLLHYRNIPYWFTNGAMSDIPSKGTIQNNIHAELYARVIDEIENVQKQFPDLEFLTTPEVSITYFDEQTIEATLKLVTQKKTAKVSAKKGDTIVEKVPIRILHLRNLAEQYVQKYNEHRNMEKEFIHFIYEDQRIYNPISIPEFSCFVEIITKAEVRKYMLELMQLSKATEIAEIRRSDLQQKYVQWQMDYREKDFTLGMVDQNGNEDRIVKTISHFGPIKCYRTWKAHYSVSAPLTFTLWDLKPDTQIASTTNLIRPLEFKFNVYFKIKDNVPFVGDPQDSGTCIGTCSINVEIIEGKDENAQPTSAPVFLGPCFLGSESGTYTDIPCGTFELSSEKKGYVPFQTQVSLAEGQPSSVEVNIREYGALSGVVYQKFVSFCDETSCDSKKNTIQKAEEKIMTFVEGDPPRYVTVKAVSLDTKEVYKSVIDVKGRYKIKSLTPGKYLLIAEASKDEAGVVGYKVEPTTKLIYIEAGESRHNIIMEPSLSVEVDDQWYYITEKVSCGC